VSTAEQTCPIADHPATQAESTTCAHPIHWPDRDPERPYYPDAFAQLSGEDGNVGAIMGRVARALGRAGADAAAVKAFRAEVMDSGSYGDVLACVGRWVEVG